VARAAVFPFPLPDDFVFPSLESPRSGFGILGPQQNFILNAWVIGDFFPDDEVEEIKRGIGRRLYIWGRVTYEDVSEEQRHTEFAHNLFWVPLRNGEEHVFGNYVDRHNYFEGFLRERLPQRYSVGKGEVVTPENQVSKQLDLVVFDSFECPKLFSSEAHSIFPIESIYGAISIKSNLKSGDLIDAYENIASLKRVLPKAPVNQRDPRGLISYGARPPVPVTGIFAYNSHRSLEAICKQVESLDQDLSNIELRPDFVAVLGKCLIGPRIPLRGPFNVYQLPKDKTDLAALRKTGRHTLLRLYLELLRELNMIQLIQFDLTNYDNMPRLVGPFHVRSHNDYFRPPTDSHPGRVSRLNEVAIREIVQNAKPFTLKEVYHHYLGFIPPGIDNSEVALGQIIYEFNPKNLPPLSLDQIDIKTGRMSAAAFMPDFLDIDGKPYAADIGFFTAEHFEEDPTTTLDELFSH
jgi:hypothetical protein